MLRTGVLHTTSVTPDSAFHRVKEARKYLVWQMADGRGYHRVKVAHSCITEYNGKSAIA